MLIHQLVMVKLVNKLVKQTTFICIQWLKITTMQIRICILIDNEREPDIFS